MRSLIELCLILILVPKLKGLHTADSWSVEVERRINATNGSTVTINCTFICPDNCHTQHPKLYWKLPMKSGFKTRDNDKNAFAFHPNNTFVVQKYKGKTELIGNSIDRDCSLKITNIHESEPRMYLRIGAKSDNYSFVKDYVTIEVYGSGVQPVTDLIPIGTTTSPGGENPVTTEIYIYIFVPVGAVLMILGAIVCICHKRRSRSLTRNGSGYYANFSRSNSARREDSGRNQDQNKDLPETKVIDEPVYVNLEQPTAQMDQCANHTENVYGNVDYFK